MSETRKIKVFRIEVLVIDMDGCGADGVRDALENARYPNRCISPDVKSIEEREVDWHDNHPLNHRDKCDAAYAELFARSTPMAGAEPPNQGEADPPLSGLDGAARESGVELGFAALCELWNDVAAPSVEPATITPQAELVLTDARIDELVVTVLGFEALDPEQGETARMIARAVESEVRGQVTQTLGQLVKFLDCAAGDGLECGGVDAADLFTALFGNEAFAQAAPHQEPGWVRVPVEMTQEITVALWRISLEDLSAREAWELLLAAAPKEPKP